MAYTQFKEIQNTTPVSEWVKRINEHSKEIEKKNSYWQTKVSYIPKTVQIASSYEFPKTSDPFDADTSLYQVFYGPILLNPKDYKLQGRTLTLGMTINGKFQEYAPPKEEIGIPITIVFAGRYPWSL